MPSITVRIFLTAQGTPVVIDGDLAVEITDGILIVHGYRKRDLSNGIVFSAAKGFWASVSVVESSGAS